MIPKFVFMIIISRDEVRSSLGGSSTVFLPSPSTPECRPFDDTFFLDYLGPQQCRRQVNGRDDISDSQAIHQHS